MGNPLVLITVSYIIGLLLGHGFLYFPWSIIILSACASAAALVPRRTGRLSRSLLLLTAIPALIGALAYVSSAAWLPQDHYTRLFAPDNANHAVVGTIVSPLDRDPGRTAFVIALKEFDGAAASGRLRVNVRDELADIGYGDRVKITGRVFEPRGSNNPGGFDYPAYLARQGIYRTVSVKDAGEIEVLKPGKGPFRAIQDLRERIRQSFIASTAGPGSAILQAMVLGEEGGLTDAVRDCFMAAGVTHILSISGSHLGLVAVICFGLIRGLLFLLPERAYLALTLHADPKKIAAWLTVLPVAFYALLAGGQTATIRSLMMILAALAAVILDREKALLHSLAAAALLILAADPQALFDISFQLSYISVLAIAYVVSLWNDLRIKGEEIISRLSNSAVLLTAISLGTSLVTAPLVALYFNQVSLAGVVSNMVVVPFAGLVVVPLGLSTGILSLVTDALPFAAADQFASDAFYSVVAFFSRLPLAEFHPPAPSALWLGGYFLLILSLAGYLRARLLYRFRPLEYSAGAPKRYRAGLIAGGAALLLSLALPLFAERETRLTFVDVGQGDCSLVELASGHRILIDGGGTYDNRFDIGRRVVAPFLWNRGIRRLDLVVLTHAHPDHMNGLLFILKRFRVSEIWANGHAADAPAYGAFREAAAIAGIPLRTVSAEGRPVRMGHAEVRVLHPPAGFVPRGKRPYNRENNRSLVVSVEADGKTMLFPGDCEAQAEADLVRGGNAIKADVLKVPHHGSKTSSTAEFLAHARPEIAVVTVGKGNRFRHPSDDVLVRYEEAGAKVYRTDEDGAIAIRVGLGALRAEAWAKLMLRRVAQNDVSGWWDGEKENWKRMGTRIQYAR